jgi:hypothetical protein
VNTGALISWNHLSVRPARLMAVMDIVQIFIFAWAIFTLIVVANLLGGRRYER